MPITPHRATRADNRRQSASWTIQGPQTGEVFLKAKRMPQAATIRELRVQTDTGTADINIELRTDNNTAGTDLLAADLQATSTEQVVTSFASPTAASKAMLFATISAVASTPGVLFIDLEWTID